MPHFGSYRSNTLSQLLCIVSHHREPESPALGWSSASNWVFSIFVWATLGTVTDGTSVDGSLVCFGFFGGRGGSCIILFPLPLTRGGRLGAWVVGSFMDNAFFWGTLGTTGSGRMASSSVGGVFLFLSSPVFFLARLLVFLEISEKRGMVSAKPTDNLLEHDSIKDAINGRIKYKGMCKMNRA